MTASRIRVARVVLLLSLTLASAARGQVAEELTMKPEIRLDVARLGNRVAFQAGGGVQVPLGYYTRMSIIGAAGADVERFVQDASGRLDVVGRFLFDPFRQSRWGLSAGAGVSLRVRARDRVRPYLVSVIDLEGPLSARGVSPAIQLGIGGGVRVGVALRKGARSSR